MSPWHLSIIYEEVIPLHIYNGINQMVFFEEHLWGTASLTITSICLTKHWNSNITGALVTSSNWEINSKNISQSKENLQGVLSQSWNSDLQMTKAG